MGDVTQQPRVTTPRFGPFILDLAAGDEESANAKIHSRRQFGVECSGAGTREIHREVATWDLDRRSEPSPQRLKWAFTVKREKAPQPRPALQRRLAQPFDCAQPGPWIAIVAALRGASSELRFRCIVHHQRQRRISAAAQRHPN